MFIKERGVDGGGISPAEIPVADGFFIGPMRDEEREGAMIFTNHSCDPNVGINAATRSSIGQERPRLRLCAHASEQAGPPDAAVVDVLPVDHRRAPRTAKNDGAHLSSCTFDVTSTYRPFGSIRDLVSTRCDSGVDTGPSAARPT